MKKHLVLLFALGLSVSCGNSTKSTLDSGLDAGGDASADSGGSDSGSDGAAACSPGVACTGFPTGGYATDATDVSNCAGFVHQTDCCGARVVFGVNHGERAALCTAETMCEAQYPSPAGCSNATITTDSGETTTNLADVRVRCVSSGGATCQCETFLCTSGACLATSGPIGSCGP